MEGENQKTGLSGQAATESLVLVGFAIAFILPLALLSLSAANSEAARSSLEQAKISARTIADEAGSVYLQGPGAKKTVFVTYPEGVSGGAVGGGLVVLSVDADGGPADVVSQTFANVSGSLAGKRAAGMQRIRLEYVSPGNYVNITYLDPG